MIAAASPLTSEPQADHVHSRFLAILPRIEQLAGVYFRDVHCAHQKADAVAESIALAWKWFVRLTDQGRDAAEFVTALTFFAARAVCSGRRLCGQQKLNDALSPLAQRRHGFSVSSLPSGNCQVSDVIGEALQDNMQTPVPEQVVFRCDFPAWRRTRTDRDRRLIDDLMVGQRTLDVAHRYGLSPARVSQLRREFHADWERFSDNGAEDRQPSHDVA